MIDIAEELITTKNGERWLHTKKIPVRDEKGIPLYLMGIAQRYNRTKERISKIDIRQFNAENF